MVAALLLTTLLAAADAQAGPNPTQEQAIELAKEKNYPAALDGFQRLAAANPRDAEARLWIGKMHAEMGHPELAVPVFKSVMLEHPDRVDARIGLSDALVSLGRKDEALVVLTPAAKADPNNAEVNAAIERARVGNWVPSFLRF